MNRRLKRIILIPLIAIILGIVIYALFLRNSGNEPKSKVKPPKVINEIKNYDYKLEENKSKYYKSLFANLKDELEKEEVNEENYAKLVAQMFIADFYNLNDKITKNDIGGTMFVYESCKANFIEQAKDTMYKYIESNVYGDRKQQLPIVKEVTVTDIKQKPFTYLTKQKDSNAYEVTLNWLYEEDLGYETNAKVIIIHDNNKLSIVEMD
jgi:hypothetical protein